MMEKPVVTGATTPRIRRILYTTDLSPDPDRALDYAVVLSLTYDAKLFLCHVLPEGEDKDLAEREREHIERVFNGLIGTCLSPTEPPKLEWEGVITSGNPAEAIVAEAIGRQIDLIVMKSRRRTYTSGLLHSVAEQVSRTAPCPVFVTYREERDWVNYPAERVGIQKIMVACDFSDYAKLSLMHAISYAKAFEAEIHLVNVLPKNTEHPWSPIMGNPVYQTTNRLRDAIPAEMRNQYRFEEVVLEGEPYAELLNYAKKNEIDLICMGAHGEGHETSRLFGSHTDRVLRNAPCPVLIARKTASRSAAGD